MKAASQALRIRLSALALTICLAAQAQLPIITSFSGNGVLLCSNLAPGSLAMVEWASSLSGPWQTNWAGLNSVTADTNGMIRVTVPMFYRVCVPSPTSGMTLIPAGSFTMGDTLDEEMDATPMRVYVSAFYMDTNLVSYSQWLSVYIWALTHGYAFDYAASAKAANHPVWNLNWYDAVKWTNARSQQAGLTPVYYTDAGLTQVYTNGDATPYANWAASGYSLPTEAQWEKAARGGLSGQRFPWGDTIDWSHANYFSYWSETAPNYSYDLAPTSGYDPTFYSGGSAYTSPVGYFAPNGYGLYDMAGNIYEWCWDWYGTPYGQPSTTGPTGPPTGSYRVLRGGSWLQSAYFARCAARYDSSMSYLATDVGFRCVKGS